MLEVTPGSFEAPYEYNIEGSVRHGDPSGIKVNGCEGVEEWGGLIDMDLRTEEQVSDDGIHFKGSRTETLDRIHDRTDLGFRRGQIEIRVIKPAANVLAFYEGRVEGQRFAAEPNWVDEGAISLGIASYAVLAGSEALVYDTHVSVERGRFIRRALEERGVEKITVLLSHWHLDHVAGNEAFGDCEILATARTAELLEANRAAIEAGTLEGPPPIDPLVLPTRDLLGRRAPRPRRHRGRADRGQHPQRRRGGDLAARAAPPPLRGHDGGHDHLRR